jgi:hypothetical protein
MFGAIEQYFNATTDIHRQGPFATNQFHKHTANKPIPRNRDIKNSEHSHWGDFQPEYR